LDGDRRAKQRAVGAAEVAGLDVKVAVDCDSAGESDAAGIVRGEISVALNGDGLRARTVVFDCARRAETDGAVTRRKGGAASEPERAAILDRKRRDAVSAEREAAVVEDSARRNGCRTRGGRGIVRTESKRAAADCRRAG